ncbi:hypothetical protein NP493_293g04077 [Ridgeia piscesae]|uniref:Cytochrome P450 n=1 Tax=Ridgeia piscesae TaxID=27915 RepID=A0AAD9UC62_RIDPI|nr:hypothetical protein NP493_293g04077 [Ridgeia piscesae]
MSLFAWIEFIDTSTLLLFLVVFLCGLWLLSPPGSPVNWPPGPKSWPLIGNADLFWNNDQMHLTFTELAKKYGQIVHLRIGPRGHMILLTGQDVIREAFVNKGESYGNRPSFHPIVKYTSKGRGIVLGHGKNWKILKRFTLRTLKDFGVGKSSLEEKIKEELDFFAAEIHSKGGEPFDLKMLIENAVSNIMCSMVFGERYDYDDEEFTHLLHGVTFTLDNAGFKYAPMAWIPGAVAMACSPTMRKVVDIDRDIKEFVRKKTAEHRETFDEQNIRDFIDIYIKAEKDGEENGALTYENLFQLIVDLFLAGTETTSTALLWAFLYMICHPDIQTRCREEIAEVIGQDRRPCMKDKGTLPYVEAAILEMHRLASIAATAISHVTSEPVTLRGYHLPKDALVIPNLYETHMDPACWTDPFAFNPDRWLDENNKLKKTTPAAFMPFSVGYRKCMGETLAKMEMFLFVTTLLQRFDFRMVDVDNPPSYTDAVFGMTRCPLKYEMIATRI